MKQKIAIVGIGCHYPGSKSPLQLWENILSKRRQFRKIINERLPLSDYFDPDSVDKIYLKYSAFIDGFDFDWAEKRIPKTAFETTDIVHWLALDVALSALEDAGLTKDKFPNKKAGVIVGNTLTGEWTRSNYMRQRWPFVEKNLKKTWKKKGFPESELKSFLQDMEHYYKSVFPEPTEDSLAGGLSNTIPGRICNFLNLHGGGYTVDGACSSSLIAVATAANALINQEMDMVIAGGVDISLDTFELVGFARAGALAAKDMMVYDQEGKGFFPGEGAGFIVMKRYEDAVRDGHYIYATLNGWGISSDGKGGITAPSKEGQATALLRAYEKAGYDIGTLNFIEGHGTGTAVGDQTEILGIHHAMEVSGHKGLRTCGLTSLKSIVGHTKAAAGVGAFIKAVIGVNRRISPPTANCQNPKNLFTTTAKSIYPLIQGEIFPIDMKIRAGISAMGFGGINSHVTIESADAPSVKLEPEIEERALMASHEEGELFLFCARSASGMKKQIKELKNEIEFLSFSEMTDLSADLSKKVVEGGAYRAAIVAKFPEELQSKLEKLEKLLGEPLEEGQQKSLETENIWIGNKVQKYRVGFLFPGQGSQYVNMGRDLVERFEWARTLIEKADRTIGEIDGLSISSIVYKSPNMMLEKEWVNTWKSTLSKTEIAQPSICLNSALWFQRLKYLGVHPSVVGGHSLGELTAFYSAGAFDFETLMKMAALRGQSMSSKNGNNGSMASLVCSSDECLNMIKNVKGYVTVANINSPSQTVISGEKNAVEEVISIASGKGIAAYRLNVSNAFHSKLVKDAPLKLKKSNLIPEKLNSCKPIVVSGVPDVNVELGMNLKDHFAEQILSQVDFIQVIQKMKKNCDFFIEVGTGTVLSGLAGEILKNENIKVFNCESRAGKSQDLKIFLAHYFVSGGRIKFQNLFENRLIRTYRPPKQLKFIENPCERQTTEGNDNISLAPQPVFVTQIGEVKNSAPTDVILNKSEISYIENNVTENSVETEIYHLISAQTGFAKDQLNLKLRLLDDLNLDSIKSASFINLLCKNLGVPGQIDPASFANAKLEDVMFAVQKIYKPKEMNNKSLSSSSTLSLQNVIPFSQKSEMVQNPTIGLRQETSTAEKKYENSNLNSSSYSNSHGGSNFEKTIHVLYELIEEMTGFQKNSLNLNLKTLDDLNLDSIKSASLLNKLASQLKFPGKIDPLKFANATLGEIVNGFEVKEGTQSFQSKTLQHVISVTSNITGFPKDQLKTEVDLISDLHINPQTVWKIFEKCVSDLNLKLNVDPEPFLQSVRTLEKISHVLDGLNKEVVVTTQQRPEFQESESWVRDFKIEYIPSDIKISEGKTNELKKSVRYSDDWSQSKALIICEQSDFSRAEVLLRDINSFGGNAILKSYGDWYIESQSSDWDYSHFIAILPSSGLDKTLSENSIKKMMNRLTSICKAPSMARSPRRTTRISYLQFGGGHFGEGPKFSSLEQVGAASFAATLSLECQNPVVVIDLSPSLDFQSISHQILEEINTNERYKRVGFDEKGQRLVPCAVALEPENYTDRNIVWSSSDVVLVTGGAKGITSECALAFAQKTKCKMALVGSSPKPKEEDLQNEINLTLARFKDKGLIVDYFSCNMSDSNSVRSMVQKVQSELGSITGVIHGAGLNKPNLLANFNLNSAFQEISPKVMGCIYLCESLSASSLKLFAAFTSVIGVMGMQGNAWYAFSNEILNLIVQKFKQNHPNLQIANIGYSVWKEVGMGARMGSSEKLAKSGIDSIPLQEGVDRFLSLTLRDPQASQAIVTSRIGNIHSWPQIKENYSDFRFIDTAINFVSGVEASYRTSLSVENDPYLLDHNFNGSLLFPTVFGLEAMAQAVSTLDSNFQFSLAQISEIKLERPIVVDKRGHHQIEIRARAEETKGGIKRVYASIRSETTNFKQDFFSAVFEFGNSIKSEKLEIKSDSSLSLQPLVDLYGDICFQGKSFQNIKKVYSIDPKETEFDIQRDSEGLFVANKLSNTKFKSFVLGDPYARDCMLQAGLLVATPEIPLPIYIERINMQKQLVSSFGILRCKALVTKKENGFIELDVNLINDEGYVLEKMSHYKVKVLRSISKGPAPHDFVHPFERDYKLLSERVSKCAQELGCIEPLFEIKYHSNWHKVSKAERHQLEIPVIQKAAERFLSNPRKIQVQWLENGKPMIQGEYEKAISISLAHDDQLCLCVVGNENQGCDVYLPDNKLNPDWNGLLPTKVRGLFEKFLQNKMTPEDAGSVLWTVVETTKKVTQGNILDVQLKKQGMSGFLFEVKTETQNLFVLSFQLKLTVGQKRTFSMAVTTQNANSESNRNVTISRRVTPVSFANKNVCSLDLNPENVFIARWPVTMRDCGNLSATVRPSVFLGWMGRMREISAWPAIDSLCQSLSTAEWVMVTNNSKVEVVGDLSLSDVVETHYWISDIRGKFREHLFFNFDWFRVNKNGEKTLVARGVMENSSCEVISHGVVRPTSAPGDLQEFYEGVMTKEAQHFSGKGDIELLNLGNEILFVPPSPHGGKVMIESFFETSLEEANSVGNVYFANYPEWQGHASDHFLHTVMPEMYLRRGLGYPEIFPRKCQIEHLREAMPSYDIKTKVFLRSIYESGFRLYFEHFRKKEDGSFEKLAFGEQEFICLDRSTPGQLATAKLPEKIIQALIDLGSDQKAFDPRKKSA